MTRLDRQARETKVIAALKAMAEWQPGLKTYISRVLDVGCMSTDIHDVAKLVLICADFPAALSRILAALILAALRETSPARTPEPAG